MLCQDCREPLVDKHVCRTKDDEGHGIHRTWIVNGEHRFVIDKTYHSLAWQNETEGKVVLVIKPKTVAEIISGGRVTCGKDDCDAFRNVDAEGHVELCPSCGDARYCLFVLFQ